MVCFLAVSLSSHQINVQRLCKRSAQVQSFCAAADIRRRVQSFIGPFLAGSYGERKIRTIQVVTIRGSGHDGNVVRVRGRVAELGELNFQPCEIDRDTVGSKNRSQINRSGTSAESFLERRESGYWRSRSGIESCRSVELVMR